MKHIHHKTYILLLCFFLLNSCAHHRDVRPGSKGIHRVTIPTDNADEGSREALRQADHYCAEKNKSAAIIEEESKYRGTMKEQDYKNAKTATKVAGVLGGTTMVFGGQRERSAGGLVGLGAAVGDAALGEGYVVEMKFECQ